MAATPVHLSEQRQIDVGIGTAPEAHALAPQIEQCDDHLVLSLVKLRRDLAAVAEAASGAQRDAVVELAIDHRRVSEFDTAAQPILARLEGGAEPAAHPGFAELQNFAIRVDAAERLHGERPIRRLRDLMDPAIVIVSDQHEWFEGLERGATRFGKFARPALQVVKG